jgi:hypothetical protein
MGSWKKSDPELLPIHRPRCPDCQTRMMTDAVSDGPQGFEQRTFKCFKCGHTDKRVLVSDPLKSDALGWLSGELDRLRAAQPGPLVLPARRAPIKATNPLQKRMQL